MPSSDSSGGGVRRVTRVVAIATALVAIAATALAAAPAYVVGADGCNSTACEQRVLVRVTHEIWRIVVADYGVARLRARMQCESGGAGGYRLITTGNGFYFAHQFVPSTWASVGGRLRNGVPIGRWGTALPTRLEQDYRAVVVDRHAHRDGLPDPWPHCP